MEINIYQVDTFTVNKLEGNPAVVVPNASGISSNMMEKIANELRVSETIFVNQVDEKLFKLRYFTPKYEVDICGHGTIGTFYTLAKQGYIRPIENGIKKVYQRTNAGEFPVEIKYKDKEVESIILELPAPENMGKIDETEDILIALDLKKEDIGFKDKDLKPSIIYTGLKDILVPIKDRVKLNNIDLDFHKIKKLCEDYDVTGVHLFYLPKENSEKVFTRYFAPRIGLNEEEATGTANGSLIYYLYTEKLIDRKEIIALQGACINRKSQIICHIMEVDGNYNLKIEGQATIVMDGILNLRNEKRGR